MLGGYRWSLNKVLHNWGVQRSMTVSMSFTVLDLAKLALAVYQHPLSNVGAWVPLRNFGTNVKHGFYAGLYRQDNLFVLAYRGTDDWQVDSIDDAAILLGWISNQMVQSRTALSESLTIANQTGAIGRKFCLTGHSLGGGLAALVAAENDLPCVTFNAPGTKRSLEAHYARFIAAPFFASIIRLTMPHEVYDRRILNVRARFDIVSVGTGPSFGVTDSINVRCEGPSGNTVAGPVQAGVDALWQSVAHPNRQNAFAPEFSFMTGVAKYTLCQHRMSKMLNEVAGFDKYKRDLGW